MFTVAVPGIDPSPIPTPPNPEVVPLATLDVPCFQDARASLCTRIHDVTGSEWLSENASWLIARPSKILAIFLIATVVRWLAHRAIRRICDRSVSGDSALSQGRPPPVAGARVNLRRRAATLGSVLESLSTAVIFSVAILMSLAELTFNIGPLIASAGIVGVAVGFGAQNVVQDFLSGVFMVLEDQFNVGDTVDLGVLDLEGTVGIVESVGLRVTSIRDENDVLWHVRNGGIVRVGNHNQPRNRHAKPVRGEPAPSEPAPTKEAP